MGNFLRESTGQINYKPNIYTERMERNILHRDSLHH